MVIADLCLNVCDRIAVAPRRGSSLLCLDPIQVRRMFGSAASIVLLQDTGC